MEEKELRDKLLKDLKRALKTSSSYKSLPKELKELIIPPEKLKSKKTGNQKFVNLPSPFWELKTADLTLTTLAVEYEAQILTFDQRLKNKIYSSYPHIYNCADEKEQNLFAKHLFRRIWR